MPILREFKLELCPSQLSNLNHLKINNWRLQIISFDLLQN